MFETANVRLVRCPKCGTFLPEITDHSVYQCGVCGAVLGEKSYEERTEDYIEKKKKLFDRYGEMMNLSERRTINTGDVFENDVRSTISSSSRSERRRLTPRIRDGESRRTNFASKDEKRWDLVESNTIRDQTRSHEHQRANFDRDFEKSDMSSYHERYGREGTPNPASRHGYDYENSTYGFSSVGDDRAELLKQLDELKDQLSRSGNLIGKDKEKAPPGRRWAHQDPYASNNWYSDASSKMNNTVRMQNSFHDPQINRSHYPDRYTEPPHMGRDGYYPPRYGPRYRSGPRHISPSHAYSSGPYMDDGGMMYMDGMDPYNPKFSHHHPSCSCYQCRNERQVLNHIPPNDRIFNHHENPSRHGISRDDPNHRFTDHRPLKSQSRTRFPSDVNSEVDGFVRRRPTRSHLPSGGKIYRPIAGGAPFFTCYSCFELLLLPEKILTKKKNDEKKKMSCKSCSTVIVIAVLNNNLVISSDVEPNKGNNVNVDNNLVKTASPSNDYDHSDDDIRSNKSSEAKKRVPTSTYSSEEEEDNESSVSKDVKEPRSLAGSSLQDHFEYSNKYNLSNRLGERDKDGNYKRKELSETEIDLSSNEYSNTGTTFDSGEGSKAANSFLGGVGFNDFNYSNNEDFEEEEKANVTVNGHLISNRSIQKAEKLAGPIHPGYYWYDFRAGFWGAIGGPCLGIIPPFIEEFNYPIPEHCAGGNTQVFVNGRELNRKDFDLLVKRGLPKESDRSYIVEISGRVLDEDTGEELQSLGKLAPTVEKMKHGFGMRVPKSVS